VVLDPPSEYEEDAASPAVMQVGKLVHAMLKAAGLDSDEQVVFLSNVSKCRIPTGLRSPQADITTCLAYLDQQIKRLQPKTLLVLGWGAAQVLSPKMEPRPSGNALGHLRGVVQHYLGIPTIVSFAPAYLIRNPQDKAKTWDDLCLLMQCLEGE
jgi:DNA polymerase